MFSVSDLSGDQIEIIRGWVADGAQMADVQKRLVDELGFKVTYMDTRFLSLDLNLEFEVEEKSEPEVVESEDIAPVEVDSPVAPLAPADPVPTPATGGVHATVDQVARPGAMVSGAVTFSDGMKAVWLIDEMGRPSIDPDQPGYQPTEADLMSFQSQLQTMLDGHI